MSSLGREIQKARIDKGLKQKDLAAILHIPQQYISRIEGDKSDVRVSTLERIARRFPSLRGRCEELVRTRPRDRS